MVFRLTKLGAVNEMLSAIGDTPVNSLDTPTATVDVIDAKNILESTLRQVLIEGWHFNTERNYKLIPDLDGYIRLPNNCVDVVVTNPSFLGCVERNGRLYSKTNRTDKFSNPVWATITLLYDFEEIPEVVREYVKIRAGRKFVQSKLRDREVDGFTAENEAIARTRLDALEAQSRNYSAFDTVDAYRTIRREEFF